MESESIGNGRRGSEYGVPVVSIGMVGRFRVGTSFLFAVLQKKFNLNQRLFIDKR
jgi:hypothetical protein